jgi:hypothetical protein
MDPLPVLGRCWYSLRSFAAKSWPMVLDETDKRGKLIRQFEDALAMTEELNDPTTGYLIERALDEARSQQFRPPTTASYK